MKNDIIFIGGTHGDEPIGVDVLSGLETERNDFDWIVGNPAALAAGKREFEGDLNRSAPGDPSSPQYAPRRAAEILKNTRSYDYIVDLHGTNANTGIFIIVTNPTPDNFCLASRFDIDRIVVWPSFSEELQGPLSECFPCGLEIECGPKTDPEVRRKLKRILVNFLDGKKPVRPPQKIFEVYGSLRVPPNETLREFTPATVGDETFFPLLVNRYLERSGVYCYKMKRLTT